MKPFSVLFLIFAVLLSNCKEIKREISIDSCLDYGGSWDYSSDTCKNQSNSVATSQIKTLSTPSVSDSISKGIILPQNKDTWSPCCIYIPRSGLQVYNEPNGNQIGVLETFKPDERREYYDAQVSYSNGQKKLLDPNDFHMVAYEINALVFIENKDGFLKIKNSEWINSVEFLAKDLHIASWKDYAMNKTDVLGWYANEPGLKLMKGPSQNSESTLTLKGDLFEINLLPESLGRWVRVIVNEYEVHPCTDPDVKVINTYSGWLQLISKEGDLNVWHYAKGC